MQEAGPALFFMMVVLVVMGWCVWRLVDCLVGGLGGGGGGLVGLFNGGWLGLIPVHGRGRSATGDRTGPLDARGRGRWFLF